MSFNLFNSDGSIDPGKFATVMRNLEFLNHLGMSASVTTNQQGGDNTTPTGMSSNGVTSATHNSPMGHNSTPANRASQTSDSANDQDSDDVRHRLPADPWWCVRHLGIEETAGCGSKLYGSRDLRSGSGGS